MGRGTLPTDEEIASATPEQLMHWWKAMPMSADQEEKRRFKEVQKRISKLSVLDRAKASKKAGF